MKVYYNEFNSYPAQWLRNLIDAGHLPPGNVDERSITEIQANDLAGYDQAHFFAGIGGWPLALKLAGWEGPVWTGSCPCQPLSSAGQRKGHADERHLWPAFYALIAEHKPPVVFGEQVASALGREWLAGVRADMENLGYAVGAADLPAASVKAPHNRARLFWVGDAQKFIRNGMQDNSLSCSPGLQKRKLRRDDCVASRQSCNWQVAEPPIPVLAYEVPNLLGATTAYGNAILPEVATNFVTAFMEYQSCGSEA